MAKNKSSGPGNITVVSYKSLSDMGQAIIQNQNDALAKITDAMAAQNGNKGGNTDLEQLEVLKKTLEVQKHLEKIAKSQQASLNKAFEEQTKGMKGFKTVGDRFNSIKQGIVDSLNPTSLKKSILGSFNAFGVLNKQIAKVDFNERQKAYGVKGDFGGALKSSRDLQKANAEIDRLKKAGGLGEKASDREIAALKGGKEALDKRNASKNAYLQFDPAAMKAMQAQQSGFRGFSPPNDLTVPGSTLTHPKSTVDFLNPGQNQIPSGKENQLEAGRLMQSQTDLLQQIADNTARMAGGGDNSAAGGAEDKGDGQGMMGKFGKTMNSVAGALGGIGKGIGLGIGSAIGGIFTGIMQGIADGIKAFANIKVVAGVAVLGLLTAVVWGLSEALSNFQQLDWETLGKAGVALVGLMAAGALAGAGVGLLAAGAAGLALLGGALWVVGKAMDAMGDGLDNLTNGLQNMSALDTDNLYGVAGAIVAIGGALAAFAAGNAFAGLMNLITNFLTIGQDSPIEQLGKIASYGDGIQKASDGISKLSDAMKGFRDLTKDDMKAINDFPWVRATAFVAAGGSMSVKGATVYNASKGNEDTKAALANQPATAAPSVNTQVQNNQNQTTVVKPNIRNQESSQAAFMAQRYRPTSY